MSKVSPAAFPRPFLGIALDCGFPGAAKRFGVVTAAMDFAAVASGLGVVALAFGGVLGAAMAGAFGGVLGAAWPRAFLTAVRITSAISSSVAPLAAGPFPAELGLLSHGCRHQGGRWLGRRWHCRRCHHCSLDVADARTVFATTCPS